MQEIEVDLHRIVRADGPRLGLRGIRGSHGFPHDVHGVSSFHHHHDNWGRDDVTEQPIEKGLALVNAVVTARQRFVH